MLGHAGGVQGHRPRRRPGVPGAHHWGERYGQGVGGAGDVPARTAGQRTFFGPELCRHSRDTTGERAIRSRKGCFHRRRPPPRWQIRASQRRHPFPRRDWRHAARLAGQDTAPPPGAGVERVGGNQTIRTDVRLIAATHRDLKAWSVEGKFRPDLYYRLGVFTIRLPPLRERGDDLALLVQFYLRRVSRELGREVREVTPEALERLRCHSWPGN